MTQISPGCGGSLEQFTSHLHVTQTNLTDLIRGAARTLEGAAVINRNASKLTRLILLHDKQLRLGKKNKTTTANECKCLRFLQLHDRDVTS